MTTKRPFILVTNDDGVHAAGIKHLVKCLMDFADLIVVAPLCEQSAVSLSITLRHPLHIEKIDWPYNAQVWTVSGTPADCVKLALSVILTQTPNLIVSGINRGSNAGRNVLYSGTVAAVVEGLMHNIPGIAFSTSDYFNPNYEITEDYIPSIVQYVLAHSLPLGTYLNVNFPHYLEQGIKGVRFAKQGLEYWSENPEQREHPVEGHSYYWLGAKLAAYREEPESDIALLKDGYVTAVPIQIRDLTHQKHFDQHRHQFESFVNQSQLSTCKS